MVPLCPKNIPGLVETGVHAALAMPATFAALGAIFQAFPALCSCEPRLPRGKLQAVRRALWRWLQHSAAPGLYLPAYSCWHPLCLVTQYRDLCFYSSINGPYVRTRLVTSQEKHTHTGSTTPPDAFAPASTSGRPRGGRKQAGLPLSAPMPTHPRRDPGPKRPRAARPQTPHYSDPHV